MTQHTTTSNPSSRSSAPVPTRLRSLHLLRAVVSLVWVALVLATSASLVSADAPTVVAAVLLVAYPLWDVVATLLERRLVGAGGNGAGDGADRVRTVNVVLGLLAAAAMVVAVLDTTGSALLVFGLWALLSGAFQLVVAIRRRRTVGAQWPMIISGGLSVVAGTSFAATSASATSGLSTIAGYSAFGAFWFLVSAVLLTLRTRRANR